MADPRDREYAELLVGTCLDVQPGWQVLVLGTPLGRPLLEEVQRAIARRGAYALLELTFGGGLAATDRAWVREAPLELLSTPAPLYDRLLARGRRAHRRPGAREHARRLGDAGRAHAGRPGGLPAGTGAHALARAAVGRLPVPDAGARPGRGDARPTSSPSSSTAPCLLDWDAERERMSRYAERFDAAEEVRIVGEGTDLRLGIAGPRG